jgi:hypothetical protein
MNSAASDTRKATVFAMFENLLELLNVREIFQNCRRQQVVRLALVPNNRDVVGAVVV